ncbi:hypothetical protein ABPG75_000705 [Micractinium tetrahymenae]
MSGQDEQGEADNLYDDFGSPEKLVANRLQAPDTAAAAPATLAAAGPAALDLPLVKVSPGAADLYADLFSSGDDGGGTLLKTQVAELSDRVQRQEASIKALKAQVEALTQQNGELSERAGTLTANISSLYNTAKLELARKVAEIRELREKLATSAGFARAPVPVRPGSAPPTAPKHNDRHGHAQQQQQHQPHQQQPALPGSVRRQGSAEPPAKHDGQQRQQREERREERRHNSEADRSR